MQINYFSYSKDPDILTILYRFSIERFGTRYGSETREMTH